MGAFINPAQVLNDGAGNVTVQIAPTYALLVPAKLNRTPTTAGQATLANALTTIEASYPASPSGLLIFSVSYGLPYFNRLPQTVVRANMPHLSSNTSRFVLEEAVPSPTDVVGGLVGGPGALIPGVTKEFIDSQARLHVFYLPPYSPDWNPDEKVWNHLKNHELKAHRAKTKQELYDLTEEKELLCWWLGLSIDLYA